MKIKNLIMIIAIIILLSIAGTLIYYSFFKVVYIQQSPYIFSVQEGVGLVGDKDAVKFGGIPVGSHGTRRINITNSFDFPVKIKITIKGEQQDWIISDENNFIVQPGNYKEIKLIVNIPAYAQLHQNYTGTITALYIKT